MPDGTPATANEFIEQQLSSRLVDVGALYESDALSLSGPLVSGVDDLIRLAVEELRSREDASKGLTVILTTDGGYIEVAQRIGETIRHHYSHVDFVVPNYAYSAGTVLVMVGDAIHMDYYSRLGPIDPQVESATTGRRVPALGYLQQWDRLLEKADAGTITAPEVHLMVTGFDQAELYQFEQARELSISLLEEWLTRYKFKDWTTTADRGVPVDEPMRRARAGEIARELSNTERWHTHGHGISREVLERDLNLKIDDFGVDGTKNSAIRQYHALLDDYMGRLGHTGAIHISGKYVPYAA